MRISGWVFALVAAVAVWTSHTRAQQPSPPPPPAAGQAPAPQSPPAPGDAGGQQKQMPTISVTTGLVHLVATVTDRRHNFITNLDRNEFKITEDGVPQEIKYFGRETDLPLRIGLLLDTSNSIRPRLEFEQDAAIDFLHSVIRRNKDMAFLMTFDNEPEVIQNFTGDIDLLTKAIRKQRAGGGTALHDAIYLAAEKLSSPALPAGPSAEVRRVLVVISDGEDNSSSVTLKQAIASAQRGEVAVYTVSTREAVGEPTDGVGDHALRTLSELTGGTAFIPGSVRGLNGSLADLQQVIRGRYLVSYKPASFQRNGRYRAIDITAKKDGRPLKVFSRKGYYASAQAESANQE